MTIKLISISIFTSLLIGYASGRRVGVRQGMQKGLKLAPINLRKTMLIDDKCPICSEEIEYKRII